MDELIVDASALLALLNDEPGAEVVAQAIPGAAISAVNLAEVVAKLAEMGVPEQDIRTALGPLGLETVPFDEPTAYRTGLLRPQTRRLGLSLADQACLALGLARECPVLTADRTWQSLDLGLPIRAIR